MFLFNRDDCGTTEQYCYENCYKGTERNQILWRELAEQGQAGALCLLCLVFTRKGSQSSQRGLCQPGSKRPCRKTGLLSTTFAIYISLNNGSCHSGCRMSSHSSSWVWRICTSPLNGRVLGHILGRRIRINSLFREFCHKIFALCKLMGFYEYFEVHFPEALLRS